METFFVTLAFFLLTILAMAVGVIFTGRRIKGSCGGLNGLVQDESGNDVCGVCGITYKERDEQGCGEDN